MDLWCLENANEDFYDFMDGQFWSRDCGRHGPCGDPNCAALRNYFYHLRPDSIEIPPIADKVNAERDRRYDN